MRFGSVCAGLSASGATVDVQLFPFQEAGRDHLAGDRVRLLADEMGLGKTIQALRASECGNFRRATVVCPAILCAEWRSAFLDYQDAPRSVAIVQSDKTDFSADVVIASYDRAARAEVTAALSARHGAHVILDEAHYLKEPVTKRTRAVFGSEGITKRAGRVSFLTGTPAPNHAGELFVMLRAAGRWASDYDTFLDEFCVTRLTPFGRKVSRYKNAAGLRELITGFMLRRTNAVELPPTEVGEIIVEPRDCGSDATLNELRKLDPVIASLVRQASRADTFADLDTPHVSTLRRIIGLAKAEATAERAAALLESEPDSKLVLFGLHRQVLSHLARRLEPFGVVQLVGGDSDKARRNYKDAFQTLPGTRVAVCQMQAAGTGLTLTAANHLWIVEPSWTPADNDQAAKRIVRIGQTRKTNINFITLNCSLDLVVNKVLRQKRQLIDEIIC